MLMISLAEFKKVACCTAIGMQHATFIKNHATGSATDNATNHLKALADMVLERNTPRNSCATDTLKPMQLSAQKNTVKVARSCSENQHESNDKMPTDYRDDRSHCHEYLHPAKVTCGQCRHFRSLHRHGKGCGDCEIGAINMYGYWIWSETPRECEAYTPKNAELSPATGEGQ